MAGGTRAFMARRRLALSRAPWMWLVAEQENTYSTNVWSRNGTRDSMDHAMLVRSSTCRSAGR